MGYRVEPVSLPEGCGFSVGFFDHSSVKSVSVPPLFEGYNPTWGQRLGQSALKHTRCPGVPNGKCYWCISNALQAAMGFDYIRSRGPRDLNKPPYYAKFFADKWSESHADGLNLRRIYYAPAPRNYEAYRRGQDISKQAPLGSVIVWDKCGRSDAGHIAIVVQPGVARADFKAPIWMTCGARVGSLGGTERIIGVFLPVH